MNFLLNPQDFTGIEGGENYLIGTSFSECHCFSRNHRQEIEKIIVDGIDKRIENKSGTLRLASFGAGGLLQDLIILGKLILKGFKNITIDFVDLLSPNQERAKKLEEMLNKLPGVTINTCCLGLNPKKCTILSIVSTLPTSILAKVLDGKRFLMLSSLC
ncbi:hypothetical protein [Parachlamydia acanthamoebae]|jgi:hypothetical protein|uniref:hypothetical protein n=1 Tax=Parachlamydia acanthamoebae TaxID=83552 RepID=UPI0024E1DA99|nr:hypothetical protein [Parachlamydia acanthamoebae]